MHTEILKKLWEQMPPGKKGVSKAAKILLKSLSEESFKRREFVKGLLKDILDK